MASKPNVRKVVKVMSPSDFDSSKESESEETEISAAITDLETCQNDLDKINEKENEEILAIEQKYKKLRQSHYDQRNLIVDNIPDFWYNVFTSHPDLCNILHEEEEDCLHYLTKVEVKVPDDIKFGYSINLHFVENPYFKNDLLVKEFFHEKGTTSSTSTQIEWKKPRPAQKSEKAVKGRKRSLDQPQTFFSWFSNNDEPGNDIIAEIIKDDVWPNPLQFYLIADDDDDKEIDSSDSSESEEVPNEANGDKSQSTAGEGSSK